MAETFEAIKRGPSGFEQRVCIKRVLPAFEQDADFVEAFLREATTSASLSHANIVQVLDFGLEGGSHYLALELIDGCDLRKLLSEGALAPELVTLIALDLGAALAHAHSSTPSRGPVVHRDISPSNVLLSRDGEVRLVDFGIAKALGTTKVTATGIIKGKVPYLPPEYIERGEFQPHGDLFALGVLLFELLAGVRPFDGATDFDTIRRITAGDHPRLALLCPNAPAELSCCIEKLIEREPTHRFESANALLEALPVIAVPAARRELATRVRRVAGPAPDMVLERTLLSSPSAPSATQLASAPTRTSVRSAPAYATDTTPRTSSSWSRRLLAASLGFLLVVGVAVAWKLNQDRAAVSVPPPPLGTPDTTASAAANAPALEPKPAQPAEPTGDAPAAAPQRSLDEPKAQDRTARRVNTTELRVIAVPFGDVWIDGVAHGHAPITARVTPGSHEVAVGDGRPQQHRTVRVSAGKAQSVVFQRGGASP